MRYDLVASKNIYAKIFCYTTYVNDFDRRKLNMKCENTVLGWDMIHDISNPFGL